MSDVFRATIPYESLDPLTIGAADDDSKVYREVLEIDIPQANLLAAIYPPEPTHLPDATAATAAALEQPVTGPRFSELIAGGKSVAIVIDNQFRPTPQSRLLPAIFDALEAARNDRRRGDLRERQGLPDVRGRHGDEDRP